MKFTKEITGTTAFLNGQPGLHDTEEDFLGHLKEIGKKCIVLDNLFEEPKKLAQASKCDNLVVTTTGVYMSDLEKVLNAFEKMNYVPKTIFTTERTLLVVTGLARELSKRGTQFYMLPMEFFFEDELNEFEWIKPTKE